MYTLAKPLLFNMDPERAHTFALKSLPIYAKLFGDKPYAKPVQVMGLSFPNPVGLAAGLDKNGAFISAWFKLGFGFVEIGTLTPQPQTGNPKPRLFRLVEDKAIINRMGFNNNGIQHFLKMHKRKQYPGILGINIGKNKTTPLAEAIEDYRVGFEQVYSIADYITLNVSSPNTEGLRQFETGEYLNALLLTLKESQKKCEELYNKKVPLVVKISPDLNDAELRNTAIQIKNNRVDGVIATNTTVSRPSLQSCYRMESGGLSGAPLKERSIKIIQKLQHFFEDQIPIIGVGGIFNLQDAKAKLDAGAKLIQVYSGLIYQGPELIKLLVRGI
ncbi:MAG TPA: quinone-dependent dihydroorotate dehydrogenase [Gammaproteobacteria bacterium]|nr:quinone-dependent dihydroorotate dehydrogenase [Gammaproteobacteria bacterium]